jgi:release factor glutamine methyltransferase
MTVQQAVADAAARLADMANPRRDAETLITHVLERDRAYLFAHPEAELEREQLDRFERLVERRASGVPIQYLTGHQEFWRLDFRVTPAVLIPRPETEHSVETALELLRAQKLAVPRIVDVGTGSGCIAIALASELAQAEIHALDISAEALAIARDNAARLGFAGRIRFAQGDLLARFSGEPASFDLVVSNPPYVGEDQADSVQREVREHEPHIAVFGGKSGAEIYSRLLPQAHALLKPAGWLVLEIGYSMEETVSGLLVGWSEVRVTRDLQGIPRVVAAKK